LIAGATDRTLLSILGDSPHAVASDAFNFGPLIGPSITLSADRAIIRALKNRTFFMASNALFLRTLVATSANWPTVCALLNRFYLATFYALFLETLVAVYADWTFIGACSNRFYPIASNALFFRTQVYFSVTTVANWTIIGADVDWPNLVALDTFPFWRFVTVLTNRAASCTLVHGFFVATQAAFFNRSVVAILAYKTTIRALKNNFSLLVANEALIYSSW
jgi:hypothetical protein